MILLNIFLGDVSWEIPSLPGCDRPQHTLRVRGTRLHVTPCFQGEVDYKF